jgi:membrane associated rhomboid family serine protease
LWNRSREALEVLPIVDSVPSRSVPVVTRALILINVIVFFIELSLPREMLEQAILYLTCGWGLR